MGAVIRLFLRTKEHVPGCRSRAIWAARPILSMRTDVIWKIFFGSVTVLASNRKMQRGVMSLRMSATLLSDPMRDPRIFAESTPAAASRMPQCSSGSRSFAFL